MPRPPTHITYSKTVHYGSGRRRAKQWTWPLIAAGVLVALILFKAPVLALLVIGGMWYVWRKNG